MNTILKTAARILKITVITAAVMCVILFTAHIEVNRGEQPVTGQNITTSFVVDRTLSHLCAYAADPEYAERCSSAVEELKEEIQDLKENIDGMLELIDPEGNIPFKIRLLRDRFRNVCVKICETVSARIEKFKRQPVLAIGGEEFAEISEKISEHSVYIGLRDALIRIKDGISEYVEQMKER